MKTFLEIWIAEAASLLTSELGTSIRIEPGGVPPASDQCFSFQARFADDEQGSLLIAADKIGLAALLLEAKVTDEQPDGERDRSLWEGMLQEILAAAAKSFHSGTGAPEAMSLTLATEVDKLSLPYELKYGEQKIQLAIADHVKDRAQAAPQNAGKANDATHSTTETGLRNGGRMELLLDIELEASLRFGSCEMPLKEVLELGPGDVIQLDRHVSDPVDLIVGDKIVARGEVVLVNGNFGLRVLEVAEPRKCLESIRCLF